MKFLFSTLGQAVFAFVFLGSVQIGHGTPSATPSATPAASPSATPSEALAFADIAPQSETALATLRGFEPDDTPDKDTTEVRQVLPDLSDRVSQLLVQGTKATVGAGGALDIIRDLTAGWRKLQDQLIERGELLGQRGRALESEQAQVDALQARWTATDKTVHAKDANVPPETRELVRDVLDAARDARERIKVRQTSVLELQTRVGDLNTKVRNGLAAAEAANAEAVKTLFVRVFPPVWSARADPAPDLGGRWWQIYNVQLSELQDYLRINGELFAIHGAIFLVLLGILLWLRGGLHTWTEEEPHLKRAAPVFEVPIATALALSFLVKGTMYAGAPTLFRALSGATALLPTVFILRRLLDRRLYIILYALILFFCVDQIRVATGALPSLNRWIFLGEMTGAIVAFALLMRAQRAMDATARAFLGRWLPRAHRPRRRDSPRRPGHLRAGLCAAGDAVGHGGAGQLVRRGVSLCAVARGGWVDVDRATPAAGQFLAHRADSPRGSVIGGFTGCSAPRRCCTGRTSRLPACKSGRRCTRRPNAPWVTNPTSGR